MKMYYIIDNFEKKTPSKDIIVEKIRLACGNTINVYQINTVHDLNNLLGLENIKTIKLEMCILEDKLLCTEEQ